MRRAFLLAALAALACGTARAQLAAAGGTTNIVIVSEPVEEPAWKRQVVMQSADGGILNDSGQVGSAAEAAAACWSGRPFETGTDGLFDGKTPFYAPDELKGYIHGLDFPVRCAQKCWDLYAAAPDAGGEPLLKLFESLKWCFRIGCHASLRFLESKANHS